VSGVRHLARRCLINYPPDGAASPPVRTG